jgi:Fe-S-cluster containining protein
MTHREPIPCHLCGVCCIVPDISTLGKPILVPCKHLQPDRTCGIYADRPPVCRGYEPDEICTELAAIGSHAARIAHFVARYELEGEAESARAGNADVPNEIP